MKLYSISFCLTTGRHGRLRHKPIHRQLMTRRNHPRCRASRKASAATRYTKRNNGSTKDGWSVEGIRHFEDLMTKVEDDRNSEDGKKFEKNFQHLMKERYDGGRKRRRPSASEQITSIRNDLSDASTSGDEGD